METKETKEQNGLPKLAQERAETPAGSALHRLQDDVSARARAETSAVLGNTAETLEDSSENLGNAVEQLMASFEPLGKAFAEIIDKIAAMFAPLGLKRPEVLALAQDAEFGRRRVGTSLDQVTATLDDAEQADSAKKHLAENATWKSYIEAASQKYNIPVSTFVAFIQMESGFRADARPVDPETKKPLSSARGLAQAVKESFDEYKRAGHPDADRENPADAIDFVGFHIQQKTRAVSAILDRAKPEQGYREEYRLTNNSPVKWLYLAYNSGERGYLAYRRYQDNPSQENFDALTYFQKRESKNEKYQFEYEERVAYASRVERVAAAYEILNFDSPPIRAHYTVTSEFGEREAPRPGASKNHRGVDMAAPEGTPVYAVKPGTVVVAENDEALSGGEGRNVQIRHEDGSISKYFHLASADVAPRTEVTTDSVIGKVGSTGVSTGPHLHFEIEKNGVHFNPKTALASAYALYQEKQNQTLA